MTDILPGGQILPLDLHDPHGEEGQDQQGEESAGALRVVEALVWSLTNTRGEMGRTVETDQVEEEAGGHDEVKISPACEQSAHLLHLPGQGQSTGLQMSRPQHPGHIHNQVCGPVSRYKYIIHFNLAEMLVAIRTNLDAAMTSSGCRLRQH